MIETINDSNRTTALLVLVGAAIIAFFFWHDTDDPADRFLLLLILLPVAMTVIGLSTLSPHAARLPLPLGLLALISLLVPGGAVLLQKCLNADAGAFPISPLLAAGSCLFLALLVCTYSLLVAAKLLRLLPRLGGSPDTVTPLVRWLGRRTRLWNHFQEDVDRHPLFVIVALASLYLGVTLFLGLGFGYWDLHTGLQSFRSNVRLRPEGASADPREPVQKRLEFRESERALEMDHDQYRERLEGQDPSSEIVDLIAATGRGLSIGNAWKLDELVDAIFDYEENQLVEVRFVGIPTRKEISERSDLPDNRTLSTLRIASVREALDGSLEQRVEKEGREPPSLLMVEVPWERPPVGTLHDPEIAEVRVKVGESRYDAQAVLLRDLLGEEQTLRMGDYMYLAVGSVIGVTFGDLVPVTRGARLLVTIAALVQILFVVIFLNVVVGIVLLGPSDGTAAVRPGGSEETGIREEMREIRLLFRDLLRSAAQGERKSDSEPDHGNRWPEDPG